MLCEIPVIILSSSTVQEDIDRNKSYGCLFITKPFEWADYKRILDTVQEFWAHYTQNKNGNIAAFKAFNEATHI